MLLNLCPFFNYHKKGKGKKNSVTFPRTFSHLFLLIKLPLNLNSWYKYVLLSLFVRECNQIFSWRAFHVFHCLFKCFIVKQWMIREIYGFRLIDISRLFAGPAVPNLFVLTYPQPSRNMRTPLEIVKSKYCSNLNKT